MSGAGLPGWYCLNGDNLAHLCTADVAGNPENPTMPDYVVATLCDTGGFTDGAGADSDTKTRPIREGDIICPLCLDIMNDLLLLGPFMIRGSYCGECKKPLSVDDKYHEYHQSGRDWNSCDACHKRWVEGVLDNERRRNSEIV